MGNGLMRRFAIVADKGVKFDAHGGKTMFGVGRAIGTRLIQRQLGKLLDSCFCGVVSSRHVDPVLNECN